jgi:hypothetical protein
MTTAPAQRCHVQTVSPADGPHYREDGGLSPRRSGGRSSVGAHPEGGDGRERVALMAARFSMHWAMPLEPGLPTHVSLVDHARDHQEGRGEGADEADALAALWTTMQGEAPREALSSAAAAIARRTGRPWRSVETDSRLAAFPPRLTG